MFSQGQWIFAGLFLMVFIVIMIYAYRKDLMVRKYYYKGSYRVLIGFLIFIVMLFVIKVFLKR